MTLERWMPPCSRRVNDGGVGVLRMSILSLIDTLYTEPGSPLPPRGAWQSAYCELLTEPRAGTARTLLDAQLRQAEALPCELPPTPDALHAWSHRNSRSVVDEYAGYLASRREGAPRRYFANRAHALYFLRAVAPTKLVDGAWLYGTLPCWRDVRMQPLVRTYLEELGDGVAEKNHVRLYRHLLAANGCDDLSSLDDVLYVQGATQLALGQLASDYLPEVLGYNLGYEQLPLHLLISAFELDELDIDPYYFQLHVTIDNSATGHAAKAVQAVLNTLPLVGDAEAFYHRVSLGYRLNDLGVGSRAVIAGFDLEAELTAMLERKRAVAGQVHSDYCRIEGRTVNQWLGAREGIGGFLDALQRQGWIKRHRNPADSRFWQLVQGERPAMFGVFSAYEQQLLHDWIAGDWLPGASSTSAGSTGIFRSRRRQGNPVLGPTRPDPHRDGQDPEEHLLRQELMSMSAVKREARLIELLAPTRHATPAGLAATRLFAVLTR